MKKLLTLFAFLVCALGANAVEIVDAYVDFSQYSDISEWNFPYSWGGSASARERLSIQDGCLHFESTEATDPSWDCQFFPIGCTAEEGVTYTLHFKIKGDHSENLSLLGFGQTPYGQFSITDEWVEGAVDYEATSSDGNLLLLCGSYVGSFDIAYLKITHEGREEKPIEWVEMLSNGDAETPWGNLANVRYDDLANNSSVCAWAKEIGRNVEEGTEDDYGREFWHPFPADIMEEDGNHVFVAHTAQGAVNGWDNEFWIMSPQPLRTGTKLKLHFRYKASQNVSTGTQFHRYPSSYMYWGALGDIKFSTEWQEYDGTITVPSDANGAQALEFTLNKENLYDAIDFYFDDLSWQTMKLDEGYFLAGINTNITKDYDDLDNAIEFVDVDGILEATIGVEGDATTWVNQLMISTVRGNDAAFKGATLKPSYNPKRSDSEEWIDYTPAANAKLDVPSLGVWKVYLDTEYNIMAFEMIDGIITDPIDPTDVVTNYTVVTVHGQEREYTEAEAEAAGIEKPENPGQPWDNQFFIKANRPLKAGELTKIVFQYKSSVDYVKTTTLCYGETPGAYMHWAAIGDVNFTTEWQYYEREFTVPAEADGMQTLCFNMAEIKEACDYQIKDVQWYLYDSSLDWGQTYENLIDAEGTKNFYVKEGAGTSPRVYDPSGEIVTPTVWTIAGSSEIFGSYWDSSDTRNDMKQIEEGFYVLEKKNVSLKEGGLYEFKVVANHSWDINYGADGERNGYNVQFTVGESGTYNLYFYFYENENHQLAYNLEFVKGEGQMLMGDVDSNGEVNVTDAVLIIDDILGRNPWNFNADAADVNYDSYINVTDVVLVIDHVLGKVNLNRAAATDAEMGAISLSSDMKTVSLTNPSAYTAFQMDVTLPKGVSLEDVLLTERAARSHSIVIREMENGSYRIIGVSMKNDAFKGNVGDLLQLQLTGNAQGSVAIDNVLFVTPQGVQHELAGVNAFGDVTGISDALRLNDNGQLINDNVFDLQGRQVNNAQLKRGLYILNGKKQVVK